MMPHPVCTTPAPTATTPTTPCTRLAYYEATLCTIDADGDGWGDENAVAPADPGTDCDDADPTSTHSSRMDCGIDRNCDGRIPGQPGRGRLRHHGRRLQGPCGEVVAAGGDLDGDGFDDLVFSHDEHDSTGRVYVFYGGSLGSTAALDASEADLFADGESNNDRMGGGIAMLDDLDGDGTSELAIGVTHRNVNIKDDGLVLLFFGGTLSTSSSIDPGDADAQLWGEAESDVFGKAIEGHGDIDDDGISDLWILSPNNDDGGDNAGKAYLFYGSDLARRRLRRRERIRKRDGRRRQRRNRRPRWPPATSMQMASTT